MMVFHGFKLLKLCWQIKKHEKISFRICLNFTGKKMSLRICPSFSGKRKFNQIGRLKCVLAFKIILTGLSKVGKGDGEFPSGVTQQPKCRAARPASALST